MEAEKVTNTQQSSKKLQNSSNKSDTNVVDDATTKPRLSYKSRIINKFSSFSLLIERKILFLNKPKWNYPSLDSIDYKQDADKLIAVAHQADLVFSNEPRVPVHRRIAYILLIVPFRIIRKLTRVAYRIMLKIYRKTRKDTI